MRLILLFFCLITTLGINASVKITEVMTCNLSTHLDRVSWNFPGYLELYNSGSEEVSLKDYEIEHHNLTSKKKYKFKWLWKISEDIRIPAKSFKLIYFDKDTHYSCHAPYKFDSDGGIIYFRDANGDFVDELTYQPMVAHISFGIDSTNNTGYMEPSPATVNNKCYSSLKNRVEPLTFEGGSPGIQTGSVSLSISCATEDAEIHYTTDGSEPTLSSSIFYDTLLINSTTVIKARGYSSSLLPSKVLSGTFIFEDSVHASCGGFTLPIVAISIDDKLYNDDTIGISVVGVNGTTGNCLTTPANFNQDWKRYAVMEYYVDGEPVLDEEVEIEVSGGCTRQYTNIPKSLKIKTGKKIGYDKGVFDYEFFSDKKGQKYESLKIRAGGDANDAFALRFRDGFFQSLAKEMNIDYHAYQPVAYYFNGAYQGMMGLREHLDEGYIVSNYGLDEDELDIIKTREVNAGDKFAYNALVSFLDDNDPLDSTYYSKASQMMDMEEYIDYYILEQFSANRDWPGNNIMCWRDRENGKFRWILYDMDATLGSSYSDVTIDPIKWCTGDVEERTWANDEKWKVVIFSNLIKNPEFQERYFNRWMMYLGTTLSSKNINAVYDSLATVVAGEFCATFEGLSPLSCNGKSFLLKNASTRIQTILSSLAEHYGYKWNVGLNFFSNIDNVRFVMNDEVVNKNSFAGYYFKNQPLKLEAYASDNLKLNRWDLTFIDTSYSIYSDILEIKLNKKCSIKAIFDTIECQKPTIVINELCTSADSTFGGVADNYGLYPDWIELFNFGEDTVDIAGLYLTDNLYNPTKYQIPYTYENTKISPHGYLILWADGKSFRGASHTNFKLGNTSGSSLAIYQICEDTTIVDQVTYKKSKTNGTYGRRIDNATVWRNFFPLADSLSEGDVSFVTPQAANGSKNAVSILCPTLDYTTKIYDGKPLSIEVTANSVYYGNETDVEYSVDNGETWSPYVPEITDKGELKVNVRAVNPRYETATCDYELTITEAPLSIVCPKENYDTLYSSGEENVAHSVMVEGAIEKDEITIEYSIDGGDSWSEEIPEINTTSALIKVRTVNPNYETAECEYAVYVSDSNSDVFNLDKDDTNIIGDEYRVYDIQGRLVRRQDYVDGLTNGLYGIYLIHVYKDTKVISYNRVLIY